MQDKKFRIDERLEGFLRKGLEESYEYKKGKEIREFCTYLIGVFKYELRYTKQIKKSKSSSIRQDVYDSNSSDRISTSLTPSVFNLPPSSYPMIVRHLHLYF